MSSEIRTEFASIITLVAFKWFFGSMISFVTPKISSRFPHIFTFWKITWPFGFHNCRLILIRVFFKLMLF